MDYRGIEALYTVLETQSFEAAAKKLYITQSAVSQRIKGLETRYGEPVLIRMLPYSPTKLGEVLIGHFKQICLLEEDLEQQLGTATEVPHISIALNRDSLETWFLDLTQETDIFEQVKLEVIADDQELTLDYLKHGLVSACLSTSGREILGGQVRFLGEMEYVLVASPAFVEKYFSKGKFKECLQKAPAIKFDKNDKLHERYLEKFFHINGKELPYQIMPSVRGFKQLAVLGYGYGLIPTIDIVHELKTKQLLVLQADKIWKIPLYWHYWAVQSKLYQQLNAKIIQYVTNKLKKSPLNHERQ